MGEFDLSIENLQDKATYGNSSAGTSLTSKISLPAGSHFSYITSHTPQARATWRSIQTSATTHTDPRSPLLYMNHSCRPSVELHMYAPGKEGTYPQTPSTGSGDGGPPPPKSVTSAGIAGEVKVSRDRDLKPGDALTFFYPSTEWSFDEAFDCRCDAEECLGNVRGASSLPKETLERYFVNGHISELVRGREQ